MSLPRIALALAALFLGSSTSSAQTLFSDDFESGLGNWTVDSPWHLVDTSNNCMLPILPFPSGTHAVWFGVETFCSFELAPWNFRALRLASPIAIPNDGSQVELAFTHRSAGEDDGVWDTRKLWISTDGGASWSLNQTYFSSTWRHPRVDLTPYAGQSITFKFEFWSGDDWDNGGLGWLIDDVVVRVVPPMTTSCFGDGSYGPCPCANNGAPGNGCANSFNPAGALITGSGTPSAGADTLSLTATGTSDSVVTYLQGIEGAGAVFHGDGLLCANTSIMRIGHVQATGGVSSYPRPGDPPVSVRGSIVAGQQRTYQTRYRNVATFCTPSTFNLTNGVRVLWAP